MKGGHDSVSPCVCFSPLKMSPLFHLLIISVLGSPPPCPIGMVLWTPDGSCHQLFSQGPCQEDQVLISTLDGGVTCQGFQDEGQEKVNVWGEETRRTEKLPVSITSWTLPSSQSSDDSLSPKEADCLSQEKVFWPSDGLCYSLLEQGPCPTSHWLVLSNSTEGGDVLVTCAPRLCPCDPSLALLCEVEMPPGTSDCKCKVALAAAQDGICGHGEQLLVNPYGHGECGCLTQPPHLPWANGKCYPVQSQGPCDPGWVLGVDPLSLEPSCLPQLCPDGKVTYQGSCHTLGVKGPCQELQTLELDKESLQPVCTVNSEKVKRVFSAIPRVSVRFGKVGRRFTVRMRPQSRRVTNTVKSYVRRRSPRKYVNWLRSFRSNGYISRRI